MHYSTLGLSLASRDPGGEEQVAMTIMDIWDR